MTSSALIWNFQCIKFLIFFIATYLLDYEVFLLNDHNFSLWRYAA